MVQKGKSLLDRILSPSHFDAQSPLTYCRQHDLYRDKLRHLLNPSHPPDTGRGNNDTIEVFRFDLSDPGIQVAPEREDFNVRQQIPDLNTTP